jgi:hypothetical protein
VLTFRWAFWSQKKSGRTAQAWGLCSDPSDIVRGHWPQIKRRLIVMPGRQPVSMLQLQPKEAGGW